MLINELEKICDQNDLVDAYNEIKEIMSKEALTQDKIEKNFSDIQIAFDKAVNFFGDNCHASISGIENFCLTRNYSCIRCPLRFDTLDEFLKSVLIYKNMEKSKSAVSDIISPIVTKIIREKSLCTLEEIKNRYGDERINKIREKHNGGNNISSLSIFNVTSQDVSDPDEALFLIFSTIYWKTSTNRFNFFISNFLNDDEFNNLCQTLFKTMRENK